MVVSGDVVVLPNDITETTTTTRLPEISLPVGLRAGVGSVSFDRPFTTVKPSIRVCASSTSRA